MSLAADDLPAAVAELDACAAALGCSAGDPHARPIRAARIAPMRVRLLGSFEIEGFAERGFGSRKGRSLLKVLAVARGRPVAVDRIADVLWGDAPPSRASDQVGVLVSRLRAVVGAERIVRNDAGYALAADWFDVDELGAIVATAAQALDDGRVTVARAATEAGLALAGAPLLPDEEGDWVEGERAAVDAALARLRRLAVEAAGAAGDDDAAAALAEGALAADPYDEAVLRSLMEAHLRAGRPGSALAAYARTRTRLAEDLGVSPTAATERLHGRVLAAADGDDAGDDPGDDEGDRPSARRDAPGVGLVGRASELAVLDDAFAGATASGASEVVVVEGDAGIGKSALVDAWGRALEATVLRGRCDELGRDLPLQPLADALVLHLRAVGQEAAAALLGEEAASLAPLLGPVAGQSATVVGDVDASRERVYAALVAVLTRVGGETPTVLIVEDLHRADAGTLAWLAYAPSRCTGVTFVVTARTGSSRLPPATRHVSLGPLRRAAVAELVGEHRVDELLARSGGHPLLLSALLGSAGDDATASVAGVVDATVASIGDDVAATLRVAAVLGVDCDVELVADVAGTAVTEVLDHLEVATRVGLLVERGSSFSFRHDLVREALEAATGGARRAALHRRAASGLASRPRPDPLAVAVHARAGDDPVLASSWYVAAATAAAARSDLDGAEAHLVAALELAPSPEVHVARAKIRMSRLDLTGAQDDARTAIALRGGASAYEVAGWVAYYRRRYDEARAFADEAVVSASDHVLRTSAAALAGRIRHAGGDLAGAAQHLRAVEGTGLGDAAVPPGVRGVAEVWLAQLRTHQGQPLDALARLARPMVDPDALAHPFAQLHLRFSRIVALGQLGRVGEALEGCADLDAAVARTGPVGDRFAGVADNVAAWVLRWSGHEEEGDERNTRAFERTGGRAGPSGEAFAEPHYVSVLDLADGCVLRGDLAAAAEHVVRLGDLDSWDGTMAWHQRHRLGVLRARLALADGDAGAAAALAGAVAEDAAARGAARYELLARAVVGAADGAVPDAEVDRVIEGLGRCAALDGWPLVAALAARREVDTWRRAAERMAATVVASSPDGGAARRLVERVFTAAART